MIRSLICFMLLSSIAATAQNGAYYYKNDGRKVAVKDSADYIRIITEAGNGSFFSKLTEYYPDNTIKTTATVSGPNLEYEGEVTSFDKQGRKIKTELYKKGLRNGLSTFYYANGKVKKVLEYGLSDGMKDIYAGEKGLYYKLVDFYDSTGTRLTNMASATVKDDSEDIYEEGSYVNGVKTGKWKGQEKKLNATFEEDYDEKGNLISGTSVKANFTFAYKKIIEVPEFTGGAKEYAKYIGKNFRYPKDAIENGISGRIEIGFVVNQQGELMDISIAKPLTPSVDQEALKLLRNSPKWSPGKQRGIPVKVAFTSPIVLNLSSK